MLPAGEGALNWESGDPAPHLGFPPHAMWALAQYIPPGSRLCRKKVAEDLSQLALRTFQRDELRFWIFMRCSWGAHVA